MRINLLSGAVLATAALLTPAHAATIFSRDASSQFERNGYAADMNRTDDGDMSSHAVEWAQATGSVDPTPVALAATQQSGGEQPAALALSSQTIAGLLQSPASTSDAGGLSPVTAGGSGSTTVGAVPLPPALPLFGAALLVVAALGRRRRVA